MCVCFRKLFSNLAYKLHWRIIQFDSRKAQLHPQLCCLTVSYGISSGSTSARMLMESVLALDVGAAANRILSRAIWTHTNTQTRSVSMRTAQIQCDWCVNCQSLTIYCGKLGKIPWYKSSVEHNSSSSSPWTHTHTGLLNSSSYGISQLYQCTVTHARQRGLLILLFFRDLDLSDWHILVLKQTHKLNVTMNLQMHLREH